MNGTIETMFPPGSILLKKPIATKQPDGTFNVEYRFEVFSHGGGYVREFRYWPEPVTDDLQQYVDAVIQFAYLESPGNYARVPFNG